MKIKVLIIFLITSSLVGYLFYDMDRNVLKKGKAKEEEQVEDKKDIKPVVKKEQKVIKDEEITEKDNTNKKSENKKEDLENKNARNIFKTHYRSVEEKKEDKPEKIVKKHESLKEFKNKFRLSFTLISDYDSLAIINDKKFRPGDVLYGKELSGEITEINEDNILVRVGTQEIELHIQK